MSGMSGDRPDEAGSPCVGCGLCCDGTVVGHLAVSDESDLGMPLRSMGVELIAAADPPVFELPCPALEAGRCTVFELHRPSACAQFECRLSRSVLSGAMSSAEARSVVAVAHGVRGTPLFEHWIDQHFRTA